MKKNRMKILALALSSSVVGPLISVSNVQAGILPPSMESPPILMPHYPEEAPHWQLWGGPPHGEIIPIPEPPKPEWPQTLPIPEPPQPEWPQTLIPDFPPISPYNGWGF